MRTPINSRNILDDFAIDFCKVVDRHCPYIIVSGFLVIATGRARATEDIDLIIPRLIKQDFSALHNDLAKSGFVSMQHDSPNVLFEDYLHDNLSIRYVRKGIPLPEMEVKFAKDPLDDYQLKTRIKIPLTGLDVWFGSINMNIAFKEELLKSDKDLEDARHLRKVFSKEIDEAEIKRIKSMINQYRLKGE